MNRSRRNKHHRRRNLWPALVAAAALALAHTKIAAGEKAAAREPLPAQIPARTFPVTGYGARGDGVTVNTAAFHEAVRACAAAGGGRVVVPAGTFITGPFELASHTALVLEKGALVQASGKFSDFGVPDPLPGTQAEINAHVKKPLPLISADRLEDVAILGAGTIDGNGAPWWARSDKAVERAEAAESASPAAPGPNASPAPASVKKLYIPRPYLITFRRCTRVHVQGVTIRNSPMFHLVLSGCREVLIEDTNITAPADAPNTDGIDPGDFQNVLIRRCMIDTGDDNIAVKSGASGSGPCENLVVTDCKFLHGHGVSIGSETQMGVRDMLVQRCSFENTGTALRIKSGRTRGGPVENITYRDITMKNVEAAITIFLFYDDKSSAVHPEAKPVTPETPVVRNIVFTNITCDGTTRKAGELAGLPESPIVGVTLENVHITGASQPFTFQDIKNLQTLNFDVQTVPSVPAIPPK